MADNVQVSVIIPAYNESAGIGNVVEHVIRVLQEDTARTFEILVVDDGSSDDTPSLAEEAGATVIRHPYNIGNGAAIKTGIRRARGETLVMMDGDGQHDPEDIPRFLEALDTYDMVVGARNADSETEAHRDLANAIYNKLASYICSREIEDLTSGFRAIQANIARGFVYLLPNTFSYPTTLTLAIVRSGYSLDYLPIKTSRRKGKSKIKLLKDGSRFILIILKIATFFSPMKVFMPASVSIFLLGFCYGLYKVLALGMRYGPTSAMLMTVAILVFMMGLVSEQISQLRFDRSEIRHDDWS
jgi:glycosyltransferase involved in cell wall biosynthesis